MDALFESVSTEHFRLPLRRRPSKQRFHNIKNDKKTNKQQKRQRTLSSESSNSKPLNPSLQEVVINALQGKPYHPQVRFRGHIRFDPPLGYLHYDRTLTEWIQFIQNGQRMSAIFPFYRTEAVAMESYFYEQQRIRRLTEKYVGRMIHRIIDSRPHDLCDLYTTLPVPPRSQVLVYDFPNRKKYMFHTHTAVKMFESSLQYSSYGIAKPSHPKNPYTNVPWTIGQTICITQQIANNLLRNHSFPPQDILNFRNADYSVTTFYAKNKRVMDIMAAQNFFKQKDDPYRDLIYKEIIDDLHIDMSTYPKCTKFVMQRTLPADIMAVWDDIVLASFLEVNMHVYTDKYRTIDDINTAFLEAYDKTIAYGRSLRPRPQVSTGSIVYGAPRVRTDNIDAINSIVQNLTRAFDNTIIQNALSTNTINQNIHLEWTVDFNTNISNLGGEINNSLRDLLIAAVTDSKEEE